MKLLSTLALRTSPNNIWFDRLELVLKQKYEQSSVVDHGGKKSLVLRFVSVICGGVKIYIGLPKYITLKELPQRYPKEVYGIHSLPETNQPD